jgi:putative ABC transport system permease protein
MRAALTAAAVWLSGTRRRPLRAALSVLGVAAGVALAFAVAANNESLTGHAAEREQGLAGRATLEVVALGPRGIDQAVARRVGRVPGVAASAPLSEHDVTLNHAGRRLDVHLVGADDSVRSLGGELARTFQPARDERALGLHLPARVSRALGAGPGARVNVEFRGRAAPTGVARVIPSDALSSFRDAPVAVVPLGLAQQLTGEAGRIHRVLVAPRPATSGLEGRLRAAAGPGAVVRPVESESELLAQASRLDRLSSSLFAAISLVIGALLAYSAIVLNAADRRREVATLRVLGCSRGALAAGVLADALVLGVLGTALGLAIGWAALGWLLAPDTGRLSAAFLIIPEPSASLGVVLLGWAAGLLTALAAAAIPARVLARVSPASALQREPETATVVTGLAPRRLIAVAAVVAGAGVALTLAGQGVVGAPLWVVGGLLVVPLCVPVGARLARRLLPRPGGAAAVGVAEVASFPARSTAIAGVVALTIAALVLVGGAVANLETGIARLATASFEHSDAYVTPSGEGSVFLNRPFEAALRDRVARLPYVQNADPWRAAFLDADDRRLLVFALATGARRSLSPQEVIRGESQVASRELRNAPDAVAMSDDLARTWNLGVGERFTLRTPTGPRRARIVATISNYGWLSGAIAMHTQTFRRWWADSDISRIELTLAPGADVDASLADLRRRLAGTGLTAVSAGAMRARGVDTARADLTNLRRIAAVVAAAGILAVTAAMLGGVLHRIRRVTALRTIGMSLPQLALALLAETGCVTGVGAVVGVAVGLVGHALVVHYLSEAIAAPATFALVPGPLGVALAATLVIALVSSLLALRLSARAPLSESLAD